MRTQDEIVERIHKVLDDQGSTSMFAWGTEVLIPYLDYEHAKEFVNEDTTKEYWEEYSAQCTDEMFEKDMIEYLEFAFGKAFNHRSLSASRSIDKLKEWLWLLNNEVVYDKFESAGYQNYGVPKLKVLADAYNYEIPDFMRKLIDRMAQGLSCSPYCDEGCVRVYDINGRIK